MNDTDKETDESPGRRKPGRKPTLGLTASQRRTIEVFRAYLLENGFPPTVAELGSLLGIKSASAHEQLDQLIKKGYLHRLPGKARGLALSCEFDNEPVTISSVPIIGCVAAGVPILAQENVIGEIHVESTMLRGGNHFALQVKGESMVDAGIEEGDVLIVRMQETAESGAIVVAMIDDEATVKRLYMKDGFMELRPENSNHEPLSIREDDDMRIIGKVVGVRRWRQN